MFLALPGIFPFADFFFYLQENLPLEKSFLFSGKFLREFSFLLLQEFFYKFRLSLEISSPQLSSFRENLSPGKYLFDLPDNIF